MHLYLMQHGVAHPKEADPDRSLTPHGEVEVSVVANHLARRISWRGVRILHSGKTRARQTAELLAGPFADAVVDESDGLAPMDDPALWAERLSSATDPLVLVGHLPHLSRLAGTLLTGDPANDVVAFRNAGVVALERDADGVWRLRWVVVPDLALPRVPPGSESS